MKLFTGTLAVLLMLLMSAAWAQPPAKSNTSKAKTTAQKTVIRGRFFADTDGDGVCDNLGKRMGLRTGAGRGRAVSAVQSTAGQSASGAGASAVTPGRGRFFIDKDNDGVCDNFQAGTPRGAGRGRFFVDADGDGLCDNLGKMVGRNSGGGGGRGAGMRGGRGRGAR